VPGTQSLLRDDCFSTSLSSRERPLHAHDILINVIRSPRGRASQGHPGSQHPSTPHVQWEMRTGSLGWQSLVRGQIPEKDFLRRAAGAANSERQQMPTSQCTDGNMNTHTETHMHTHVHVHTHVHAHICTQTHMHAPAHMCTHSHRHTDTNTCVNTHAHTHTHTHTHTHHPSTPRALPGRSGMRDLCRRLPRCCLEHSSHHYCCTQLSTCFLLG
jgi:hypothetical protein